MNRLSAAAKSFCLRSFTSKAAGVFLTPKVSLPQATAKQQSTRFKPTLMDGAFPSGPALHVPPHIPRPSYSSRAGGVPDAGAEYGEVKGREDTAVMRAAGRVAGEALQLAVDSTRPGVTGTEVEKIVHDFIVSQGAYPSPLNFHGFPKSLVISVNEACCHGIPNDRPFKDGDVVKYDCIVYFNGCHGDCAATVGVGAVKPEHEKLMQSCRTARDEAIKLCKPGVALKQIGDCISEIAEDSNFGVIGTFCGHFIGREMHMLPLVQNTRNDDQYELVAGNCLTIEPIFTEGSTTLAMWKDGWTVVSNCSCCCRACAGAADQRTKSWSQQA